MILLQASDGTSGTGAAGLDLYCASHVIFLDVVDPNLDAQCCGRVRRISQTRETTVWRLHAADSVDRALQDQALQQESVRSVWRGIADASKARLRELVSSQQQQQPQQQPEPSTSAQPRQTMANFADDPFVTLTLEAYDDSDDSEEEGDDGAPQRQQSVRGRVWPPAESRGGGAGSSSGAGVVKGLEEVMAAADQTDKYEEALAWCMAQGVTTVEMLQEFGVDELAEHLDL